MKRIYSLFPAEDFVAAIQESSIADDVNDYNITTFEEFYVDDTDDENDNHNDDNTQHKDKQAGCRSSRCKRIMKPL